MLSLYAMQYAGKRADVRPVQLVYGVHVNGLQALIQTKSLPLLM
jgi:hypothetical protein